MKFSALKLQGAFLIELEKFIDDRGTFARQFCKQEFLKNGIDFEIKQSNISENYKTGTLRGLHYQKAPFLEQKIVSCFSGSIYDVIVDLRKDSATYLQWEAQELSAKKAKMIYIPAGFAHGFETLEDNSVVFYQLGEYFHPTHYAGIRYDDPKLNIEWPITKNLIINERDANYELL